MGDTEAHVIWRWKKETESRPEIFSYFEAGFPLQRKRRLIGTKDWEFKFGTGMVRGLSWGTITVRGAVNHAGGKLEPGEYAFEYLRKLSNRFRVYGAIEGTEDEAEFISELQVFLRPHVFLKFNNAVGLTCKAPDWAPEFGIMSFR